MMSSTGQTVLSDEMLARFAKRAPQYDRDNMFFADDFEELRQAGYLKVAVPAEFGGAGLPLSGVAAQQRRLGYYAAPTALAINMHIYWTGIAADLWRHGDTSQRWLLEAAAAGEVFAAGHAESGIDMADPSKPKIVHAFMPRDTEGYRIEQTWDVMGMRATRSDDTILDGVFIPDRYVVRVVPAGAAGIDLFVLSLLAWALIGFGNIYYGLAKRALDLT